MLHIEACYSKEYLIGYITAPTDCDWKRLLYETDHNSASSSICEGFNIPGTRMAASFSSFCFASFSASLSARYRSALSVAENSLMEIKKSRRINLKRSKSFDDSAMSWTKELICALEDHSTCQRSSEKCFDMNHLRLNMAERIL